MSKMSNYTVLNSQHSALRNMFLTSSVGIAVIGFSNIFQNKYADTMKIIGTLVLLYSMFTGIICSYQFSSYLKGDKCTDSECKQWNIWVYMGYIYAIIVLAIIVLFSYRKLLLKK